jgi:hypothetical protein
MQKCNSLGGIKVVSWLDMYNVNIHSYVKNGALFNGEIRLSISLLIKGREPSKWSKYKKQHRGSVFQALW